MGYFRGMMNFAEMTLKNLEAEWRQVQARLQQATDARTVSACLIHQSILEGWMNASAARRYVRAYAPRNAEMEAAAKRRYREKLKAQGTTAWQRLSPEARERAILHSKMKRAGVQPDME